MTHYSQRLLAAVKTAEQASWQAKERLLRELGVTVAQQAVLTILSDHDGLTSAELARRAEVTPQTMTSTVGRMEAGGLVTRTPHPLHGTLIEIHLTGKGRELFDKTDSRLQSLDDALAEGFAPGERETLRRLLALIAETARSHSAR